MKRIIMGLLRFLYHQINQVIRMMISFLRMILYSKFNSRCPDLKRMSDQAFIFGNGQSLNKVLVDNIKLFSDQNVIVVNDFFFHELFTTLKPKVYVIADPGYWEPDVTETMRTLRQKMKEVLLHEVDWKMFFFVPSNAYRTGFFQGLFKPNPLIQVTPFNDTHISGPTKMRYFFFDHLLAKPFSGNVIGSALFIAFQMDIQKVFLFGVEHSWTTNLYVDESNQTCIRVEHFHPNDTDTNVWVKASGVPYRIYEALYDISNMLRGYSEINDYALYKGIRIYNCTPGSFIDAFERIIWRGIQ